MPDENCNTNSLNIFTISVSLFESNWMSFSKEFSILFCCSCMMRITCLYLHICNGILLENNGIYLVNNIIKIKPLLSEHILWVFNCMRKREHVHLDAVNSSSILAIIIILTHVENHKHTLFKVAKVSVCDKLLFKKKKSLYQRVNFE